MTVRYIAHNLTFEAWYSGDGWTQDRSKAREFVYWDRCWAFVKHCNERLGGRVEIVQVVKS